MKYLVLLKFSESVGSCSKSSWSIKYDLSHDFLREIIPTYAFKLIVIFFQFSTDSFLTIPRGDSVTPVFKSYEISENGQILRIQNVQLADSGQYKCLVTNAVGTDSTTFNVETFTPPQIHESESTKNMTGLTGETDWCYYF